MRHIFVIFFSLISLLTFSQDKVKFTAAGVTCSLCSNAIHKNLTKDTKIKVIDPNLQTQEWNLTYETGKFDLNTLKKQVEDAGFSLAKVWLNGNMIYQKEKKKKNGN